MGTILSLRIVGDESTLHPDQRVETMLQLYMPFTGVVMPRWLENGSRLADGEDTNGYFFSNSSLASSDKTTQDMVTSLAAYLLHHHLQMLPLVLVAA